MMAMVGELRFQAPYMHDGQGAIGIEFEYVQLTVLTVERHVADAVAALITASQVDDIPFRRIEIEMLIDVHDRIRLWLPGF